MNVTIMVVLSFWQQSLDYYCFHLSLISWRLIGTRKQTPCDDRLVICPQLHAGWRGWRTQTLPLAPTEHRGGRGWGGGARHRQSRRADEKDDQEEEETQATASRRRPYPRGCQSPVTWPSASKRRRFSGCLVSSMEARSWNIWQEDTIKSLRPKLKTWPIFSCFVFFVKIIIILSSLRFYFHQRLLYPFCPAGMYQNSTCSCDSGEGQDKAGCLNLMVKCFTPYPCILQLIRLFSRRSHDCYVCVRTCNGYGLQTHEELAIVGDLQVIWSVTASLWNTLCAQCRVTKFLYTLFLMIIFCAKLISYP